MGEKLFSSDPRLPEDKKVDSSWEDLTPTEEAAMAWFGELSNALWSKGIKVTKDSKILEVGTGKGVLLRSLQKRGYDIVGVDGRPRHEFLLPIAAARVEKLPFADETFDVVLSRGTFAIEYVQNQKKMLDEVTRVLKPNGIFYGFPLPHLIPTRQVKANNELLSPLSETSNYYKIFQKRK